MQHNVIDTKDVVIRFCGDSGDGMQLTGTLFADASALYGNEISTFPDYPAEIRAPHGTVSGVSGFQVHVGSVEVNTPGDYADVLVAMNPAALRANAKWAKATATIIIDTDSFGPKDLEKAAFQTEDYLGELGVDPDRVIACPLTTMVKDCLKDSGMDVKSIMKCRNMFALGMACFIYSRPLDYAYDYLERKFGKKHPEMIEPNRKVIFDGFNYASNIQAIPNTYNVAPSGNRPKGRYRNISGNQALAWGLLAASEKSGLPLFCGSYPIDRRRVTEEYTNRFGAYTLACYFSRYLGNHGIRVSGRYADISPVGEIREDLSRPVGRPAARLDSIRVIGSTQSPRLGDLVFDTNVHSDNYYAETLLRVLAKERTGSACKDSCTAVMLRAFKAMKVAGAERMQFDDGCGLSRKNYVSPDFFVRFLMAMRSSAQSASFEKSIPQAGTGTLSTRLQRESEETRARVHMKSGSMNGVRCFSGYIMPRSGRPEDVIVFSFMTNNTIAASSRMNFIIDRIAGLLANEN